MPFLKVFKNTFFFLKYIAHISYVCVYVSIAPVESKKYIVTYPPQCIYICVCVYVLNYGVSYAMYIL